MFVIKMTDKHQMYHLFFFANVDIKMFYLIFFLFFRNDTLAIFGRFFLYFLEAENTIKGMRNSGKKIKKIR